MEVRTASDGLVILDAGTGIRELGRALMGASEGSQASSGGIRADIFLTHAHWDHIQGIPFFAPIFQSGNRFTIWGSAALEGGIEQVIHGLLAPVVFPVSFDALKADIGFREMSERRYEGEGYTVTAFAVQHPGGALGFRFSDGKADGRSFVYISDNELGMHESYDSAEGWRDRLVEWMRGAAVLVHDATYTAEEYERHRGWGHSTFDDAVGLALDAGVEELVLFHHRPERGDDDLDRCVAAARGLVERRGGRLRVTAAAEGMTLTV